MNGNNLSRCSLLEIIDKVSFAMDDTRLFLDTHPDCTQAMNFFETMKAKREAAIAEYTRLYGPICAYDVPEGGEWSWNAGPWPWQCSYSERRS